MLPAGINSRSYNQSLVARGSQYEYLWIEIFDWLVMIKVQINKCLVLEGPVSGLEKDWNWTGLDQKKDRTAVLVVFHI